MRAFLLDVLPSDVEVVLGQPNRVAEPASNRFVIMSPPRFERLETNVDSYLDTLLTGSIAGTTMTITAVSPKSTGALKIGSRLFGAGLAGNSVVTALGSGSGGVGTYQVSPSQNVTSRTIAAGVKNAMMPVKATVQLDFHAADGTSGDLANTVSALMRDAYAVSQFANQSPNFGVVPLLADDAAQRPFFNDQQMVEWRWVVEALLQANVVLSVPQQFTDSVDLDVISVEAAYPSA